MPRQKIIVGLALFAILSLGAYLMYDMVIGMLYEGKEFSDGAYFATANLIIMYISLFQLMGGMQINSGKALLAILSLPLLVLVFIWVPVATYTWHYIETSNSIAMAFGGFFLYAGVGLAPAFIFGIMAGAVMKG